jgi:hypothetical protein
MFQKVNLRTEVNQYIITLLKPSVDCCMTQKNFATFSARLIKGSDPEPILIFVRVYLRGSGCGIDPSGSPALRGKRRQPKGRKLQEYL